MSLGYLHLVWRTDLQRLDRGSAAALLRATGGEHLTRSLRRLLGETLSAAAIDQLDDVAVIEQVAARMESGELVPLRSRRRAGTWVERVQEEAPIEEPVLAPRRETTWVGIRLVDEEGEPVPGEAYELTLPDGTIRRGKLNYLGRARVDGIDAPGECAVSFPELDAEAWQPA